MKCNELNEGEKRLAVVKFEMTHGDYEYNLINLAMSRVDPAVYQTADLMYKVSDADVTRIKAAVRIEEEYDAAIRAATQNLLGL